MRPALQRFFGINSRQCVLRIAHRQTPAVQQTPKIRFVVDGKRFSARWLFGATTTGLLPSNVSRVVVSTAFIGCVISISGQRG